MTSTTKESVANMALQTGERLKTGALGFFRGLEATLQNRDQLEVAIAKMFGACTGDAVSLHSGAPRDADDNEETRPTPGRLQLSLTDSRESLGLCPPATPETEERLGAAPLQRENSRSSRKKASPKSRRKSSASASSGSSQGQGGAAAQDPTAPRERRQTRGTDYGEHIYAQLFMDDQKRAAQAVNSLRQAQSPSRAPAPPSPRRPFPASSPAAPEPAVLSTPLKSNDLHILALSFDDGISAISQHTLEAMADRQGVSQVRSTDSSLWSSLKNSNSFLLPPVSPPHHPTSPTNPRALTHVRSHQSHKSRTSATTKSSGDTSFQHLWQQEEERFWTNQVDLDSSRKSRKSGASVRCPCLATVEGWFCKCARACLVGFCLLVLTHSILYDYVSNRAKRPLPIPCPPRWNRT